MKKRPILDEAKRTEAVAEAQAAFHEATVQEVADAVAKHPVVLVGMAQNPVVKRAREALTGAGIEFHYLEYGSYLSEWKRRLAIKMWAGWPTFPQVYVKGTLIGGNKETRAAIEDGSLKKLLEG